MRFAGGGERERALELAAAYAGMSPAARAAVASSRGGCCTMHRPISARSTYSRQRTLGRSANGRASSARPRRGWVEENVEPIGLGADFRRRREDTARRRMTFMNRPQSPDFEVLGLSAVNDLESLEEENQRLKVAWQRVVEENMRYRVNKTRLEAELLRSDGKVEVLLAELEQVPGKRDQRLLDAARREIQKCAVVRTLATQKEHLQKRLARQERELATIKQTKEWSAVLEMTAATEEYFLEIRRLQRLMAQQEQQQPGPLTEIPGASLVMVGDNEHGVAREEYISNGHHRRTHRRSSGVDDTIWVHGHEARHDSTSLPRTGHDWQDAQHFDDAETIVSIGGGELYCDHHEPGAAPAGQAGGFCSTTEHWDDNGMLVREWGDPVVHRRPPSPKRRVSPPRRAQMATRAGQETLRSSGNHENILAGRRSSLRVPQQMKHEEGNRKRKGGAQSQVSMRTAAASTEAHSAFTRPVALGLRGSLLKSAPRMIGGNSTKNIVDPRRTDATSSSNKQGRPGPATARDSVAGGGGSGGGRYAGRHPKSRLSSRSATRPSHHRIPVVAPRESPAVMKKKGKELRQKTRPRSASPRRFFSGKGGSARDTTWTANDAAVSRHHVSGTNDDPDGIGTDGDTIDGDPSGAADARSPPSVESDLPAEDRRSDNVYYDEDNRFSLSSRIPSRKSLVEVAPAAMSGDLAPAPISSAKDTTHATTGGQDGRRKQLTDNNSTHDQSGSRSGSSSVAKDEESGAKGGKGSARNITGTGSSSSMALNDEAGESPVEIEGTRENFEEGTSLESMASSADVDVRQASHDELKSEENSTTGKRSTIERDGNGKFSVSADNADGRPSGSPPRTGSNDSRNNSDNEKVRESDPRVASQEVMVEGHQSWEELDDGVGEAPITEVEEPQERVEGRKTSVSSAKGADTETVQDGHDTPFAGDNGSRGTRSTIKLDKREEGSKVDNDVNSLPSGSSPRGSSDLSRNNRDDTRAVHITPRFASHEGEKADHHSLAASGNEFGEPSNSEIEGPRETVEGSARLGSRASSANFDAGHDSPEDLIHDGKSTTGNEGAITRDEGDDASAAADSVDGRSPGFTQLSGSNDSRSDRDDDRASPITPSIASHEVAEDHHQNDAELGIDKKLLFDDAESEGGFSERPDSLGGDNGAPPSEYGDDFDDFDDDED